jgi:hypothetical protein
MRALKLHGIPLRLALTLHGIPLRLALSFMVMKLIVARNL